MAKNAKSVAETVRALAEPLAEEIGCWIWDVEYVKEGARRVLRITIDSEEGVDINQCEALHRAIDPLLDEADPIESNYLLEVSSPGLERRLSRVKHFQDNIGKTIDIRLYRALGGKKKMTVILKDADDEGIIIVDGDDTTTIKYEDISKASLHFEF